MQYGTARLGGRQNSALNTPTTVRWTPSARGAAVSHSGCSKWRHTARKEAALCGKFTTITPRKAYCVRPETDPSERNGTTVGQGEPVQQQRVLTAEGTLLGQQTAAAPPPSRYISVPPCRLNLGIDVESFNGRDYMYHVRHVWFMRNRTICYNSRNRTLHDASYDILRIPRPILMGVSASTGIAMGIHGCGCARRLTVSN